MREWFEHLVRANPVFDKEMRLRWHRGRLWAVPGIAVGGLVALVLLIATIGLYEREFYVQTYPQVGCVMGYVIALVAALLVTPALTAGTLAGERQQRTLELLMITRVTTWQIIMGKLVPALLPVVLTVVPCLCVSSTFGLFGSAVDPDPNAWQYWTRGFLQWITAPLSAIFAGCVAMFFSAVCPNVASATAWAYAVTLGTYCVARYGLWLLSTLGVVSVNPNPSTLAGVVGQAAIVWIVFAWMAAGGLYGARWRLEREAELR